MLIGQVGCGPWGANVLRDLRTLGCEVAVAARHGASRDRATVGGASCVVETIRQLTDLPGIFGFVVVNDIGSHAPAIEELLPQGLPIFVEKPLCSDPDDAARLALLGSDTVFLMDKWRYHPGIRALKHLIDSGGVGDLIGMRTRRNQWGSNHADAEAPWTLMPHDLAIIDELLGSVPAIEHAVADYVGGRVQGIAVTFGTSPWASVESFARAPRSEREVLVFGSEATAVLSDGWSDHIQVFRGDPDTHPATPEIIQTPGELPLLAELREFVEYLRGGPTPRAGVARAAEHVHILANVIATAKLRGTTSSPS